MLKVGGLMDSNQPTSARNVLVIITCQYFLMKLLRRFIMNVPKEGDRVYVSPYTVPGNEDAGYSGTVLSVSEVNHNGHFIVYLTDCTGKAKNRTPWLHHISGYN